VRVSTYYENEGTIEAFSFLRFVHARSFELMYCPRMDEGAELWRKPVPALSVENECAVLQSLAELCAEQLGRYPTTLESDVAVLRAGRYPFGSNRRNALVLLKGEKEVCHYYIDLAAEAVPVLQMPWPLARDVIAARYAGNADIDKYMTRIAAMLIKRKADNASPLATGGGGASGAPTAALEEALRGVRLGGGPAAATAAAAAPGAPAAAPCGGAAAPGRAGSGSSASSSGPSRPAGGPQP
jgi:hypothetical protein